MSLFLPFAELCDALAATTKKLEKRAFIADYLRTLPIPDAGRAALWLSGTPFPETDSRALNIGGSLLSKAITELSGATSEALSAAYRRHGDFGSAAADLLYGHAPTTATITLADVESALASIAEARGPAPKLRLLLDLLAAPRPTRPGTSSNSSPATCAPASSSRSSKKPSPKRTRSQPIRWDRPSPGKRFSSPSDAPACSSAPSPKSSPSPPPAASTTPA
jgi:hypothetical protein